MPGLFKSIGNFFFGTPEKHKRVSTLQKEQQPLFEQLMNANANPGAGGSFGTAADYYRDLLSNNSQTAQAMFAPEMRRFREDIIPSLSEQFAGMGSGALQSSGFRNAAVNAGADLSERLGAIRANLRSQGAAGLANLGGIGLQNFSQDVMTQPGSPGLLGGLSSAIGQGLGQAVGSGIGNKFGNWFGANSSVGRNTSPYGNSAPLYDQQFRRTGVF